MKKLSTIILFIVIYSLAADCGLKYPVIEIIFKDSTLWWRDLNSFFGAGPILLDGELTTILEDGYNCEKQKYEKAFIDTNTYLHRDYTSGSHPEWRIINIGQNDLSTYNVGDVFKDEFMHWQQCGMLKLTYEEADSIATLLTKAMDDDFENELCSCYESDIFFATEYPTGGEYPASFVKWAEEACATVSIALQKKPANASIVFEKGIARIPEHLRGESYFIFDMNGRVIKKGKAGEMIRMPDSPAILKIGIEKPILLK